ncbi:MAG: NADH:flavin oxidoreductase [Promethearchaeota archaeon]
MENVDLNNVFSPRKINNIEIPNRLVRSATYECMATPEGHISDKLIKMYEDLARGGIGLTITGVTYIHENMRWLANMMGNYSDDLIEDLSRISGAYHDVVKEIGNKSKIFCQIGACGAQMSHWGSKAELISSSPYKNQIVNKMAKELTTDEIFNIAECFGEAVNRAKKAGFDGVQYHGAHGYLITQFYSPYFNKRYDDYGGSTENRARFLLNILNVSRQKVGKNFPITLKMNGSDRIEGGLKIKEAAQLASIFAKEGIDAIEISSYIWDAGALEKPVSLPPESQINLRKRNMEAYNLDFAKKIKGALKKNKKTNIPVILVGGLFKFKTIKDIIEKNDLDFCALSRPLIREPNLPLLWQKGPPYVETKCVHCNLCTKDFLVKGSKCKGVRCILKEKEERKLKKQTKK